MPSPQLIAVSAVALNVSAAVIYLRAIVSGRAKPHAFSWIVWAMLDSVACAGQLAGHGGAGAYVTAGTATGCALIAVAALRAGERSFHPADWLAVAGVLLAVIGWALTDNPGWSVLLVTLMNVLGFVPTCRKAWAAPHEESVWPFACGGASVALGITALAHITLLTVVYPASIVAGNCVFLLVLNSRRRLVAPAALAAA